MRSARTKAAGWRRVAVAVWGGPNDPQIYGDLEMDATRLLEFIEGARRATGVHVTVTHAVGKAKWSSWTPFLGRASAGSITSRLRRAPPCRAFPARPDVSASCRTRLSTR